MSLFGKVNKEREKTSDERQREISEFLSRAVEDVFVLEDLKAKLLSGKKLRVKFGIDPTSPHVHLGRAIPLRKLRKLQDMGHTAVLIVGDFTAQIGDPSDKISKRPMLTPEKIKENLKNYKEQIGKIVDLKKAEFHYNSKWLSKLGFQEIAELAESFSLQQMLARRNFKDRIEKQEDISLRELLYPLMQGYDSVAVNSDVEIGGFDQLFNVKAGRIVQKHYGKPEQNVITFKMLVGTDGRKMSSSWGNVISLTDSPNDMYGKVMSLRDDLIIDYFTIATDKSNEYISEALRRLESGENPKNLKQELAREIVTMFHGEKDALKAEDSFNSTFSKKEVPDDIATVDAPEGAALSDTLVNAKVVSSKSDFARLVKEKGITVISPEERKIENLFEKVGSVTLRVGKRRFVKIRIKK